MEFVINIINNEVQDIAKKTVKGVDELTGNTKRVISDDLIN